MFRIKQYVWIFTAVSFLALLIGCSGSVSTSETLPSLVSIQVSSPTSSIAKGSVQQFIAIANYSDNTTQDFTTKVTWISSNTAVATISGTGLATSLAAGGPVTIVATFGGMSGTALLTSTTATLVSIQVTPSASNIAKGTTQQFTAIGNYSDNTTQDLTATALWSSNNTTVAPIDSASGIASGAAAGGPVTITASYNGISGTASIDVTSASLVSIQVTPATSSIAKGTAQQFTAIGNYSDNSSQNLTTTALWSSSNTSNVIINKNGLATGALSGDPITITATLDGKSGTAKLAVTAATLASIQVTPPSSSVSKGISQQLTAIGTYSDNTTQNLTTTVSWVSSTPTISSVSASGLAKGVAVGGPVTITATYGGASNSTSLTVTPAILNWMQIGSITPAGAPSNMIFINYPKQLTVTGYFSDGTSQMLTTTASWISSNTAIASINSDGLATGVGIGPVTFTATFGGQTTAVNLNVDIVKLISVTVPTATFPTGESWQYKLYGRYNNQINSYVDFASVATWSSDNPAVANVSASGVVTGIAAGSTAIRASYAGFSDWGLVTISPPPATPTTTTSCGGAINKICLIAY